MVDYQRRSVFYFEEKQQVDVERYSDRNVKQKTQTKFPQFVTTLKGVREYIPPELQKAMTRGTPLAKLVEKYHAIKERNPDVKRCHTLADLMKMEEEKKKSSKKKSSKTKDDGHRIAPGKISQQEALVASYDITLEADDSPYETSSEEGEDEQLQKSDAEDFNDYAENYDGSQFDEDDAES